MTKSDAIEAAKDFSGVEVDHETIVVEERQNSDGSGIIFKVELTSDVTVWVDEDGNCEYDR